MLWDNMAYCEEFLHYSNETTNWFLQSVSIIANLEKSDTAITNIFTSWQGKQRAQNEIKI